MSEVPVVMTMASILFWCMRARARSRRCSRSARVMGTASLRRLVRATMAGGSFVSEAWCGLLGAGPLLRGTGHTAAAVAARRKRRREGDVRIVNL